MQEPVDPLQAASHPDPYPYYAGLVSERPFHFDEVLGMWVAAGAAAVEAVLTSGACRVRPASEPVPGPLAGTTPGEIFGQLARMTDGPRHAARKAAIQAALASVNPDGIEQIARDEAARLIEALRPQEDPARVTAFAFQLPVRVVGLLLGIEPDDLAGLAASTGDFVRAVAPGGGVDDPAYGMAAADALRERIDALLARDPGPLLSTMWARMPREADEGCDVVVANAVGLLMQSYEATAGLIGNVLVALARYGAWPGLGRGAGGLDYAYVEEVLRFDAPVQNTRRYVAEDTIIAGRELRAGDAILVLLAAANRDPAANPAPHLFDPGRRAAQHYTFGAGAHQCPGSTIAAEIALEGVRALIAAGCSLEALVSNMTYVATPNVRIPLFRA